MRRYRRSPDLLTRETPDFVVVARLDGTRISLVGSGVAVWSLLDEPRTLAELADALSEAYDADATSIAEDVEPLLEQLTESGFVSADG